MPQVLRSFCIPAQGQSIAREGTIHAAVARWLPGVGASPQGLIVTALVTEDVPKPKGLIVPAQKDVTLPKWRLTVTQEGESAGVGECLGFLATPMGVLWVFAECAE